jgi:hypothetical protein
MNTEANAKASARGCHLGPQETFDRHDGNDDPGRLGGLEHADRASAVTTPAPVAYPRVELFDHHLVWGEPGAHHQHDQSPDGLLAVIGGSAMAAGENSDVTGFVDNFAEDRGDYSIAMGKAIFEASAYGTDPGDALAAADTFIDVSGADFIFEHEIGQSERGPYDAWARSELDYFSIDMDGRRRTGRSSSTYITPSPSATVSRSGRISSRATSRKCSHWLRRTAPTPCPPPLRMHLPSKTTSRS